MSRLVQRGARGGAVVFLIFAATYFLSALLRAVTATLAPQFSAEFQLGAADLGLLAGAYFLGFSLLQLPLGSALDRWGPRRVEVGLLAVAVLGCMLFASATGFVQLVLARVLIGMGVAACLMAPLTYFRRHLPPTVQLRLNSWMLMTGSLGMVASTVPVQLLLPTWGWRGLFWLLSGMLLVAMVAVVLWVPHDPSTPRATKAEDGGYAAIARHPVFASMAPLGFVLYGGMVAVQSLWAGPWLTRVCGWTAEEAAQGLFGINLAMLLAFFTWGVLMPRLVRNGVNAVRLMSWGLPLPIIILATNVALGSQAQAGMWALWCVSCTVAAVSQPAVAAAFPPQQAGRALSAFNLLIFAGVFCIQWGIGLLVDGLRQLGYSEAQAFRAAFGLFGVGVLASYLWFLRGVRQGADNRA
jgi:predicted MFS family arabinose efflux permease